MKREEHAPLHDSSKKLYFLTFFAIILTICVDSALDALLEKEDFLEQVFSPPRLAVWGMVFLSLGYIVSIVARNSRLRKSHYLQLAAMESSVDGIGIVDANAKVVYSNAAHTRLFGYQPEEIVGKSWPSFYAPEELERFFEEVMPVLEKSGHWSGEAVAFRKDGSRFPVEISLTRIKNGCTIRVVRDITEKKKHQVELERTARELVKTNNELKTFSYSLSHDMRSYITRVSSSAQLLADSYRHLLDEDGRFVVESIGNAADGMEQLVESIQMLAALSQCTLRLERVDLSGVVAGIVADLALNDHEREVEAIVQPGIVATCDAKLVKVALHNLITNAWKYTGMVERPRIEFGMDDSGDRRVMFVRDNGMGFDPAEAEKLFQPFQRLEKAKEFPGTGVGLAMVQRVIELHHGEVWGVGEPGKEATFFFTIGEKDIND